MRQSSIWITDRLKELAEGIIRSDSPQETINKAHEVLDVIKSAKISIDYEFAEDFVTNAIDYYVPCVTTSALLGSAIFDGAPGALTGFIAGQPEYLAVSAVGALKAGANGFYDCF